MGGEIGQHESVTGPQLIGCEKTMAKNNDKKDGKKALRILRMRIRDMMNGVGHAINFQLSTKVHDLTTDEWKLVVKWVQSGESLWQSIYTPENFEMNANDEKVQTDINTMLDDLIPHTMTKDELRAHKVAAKAALKLQSQLDAIMAKVTTGELTADAARKLINKL